MVNYALSGEQARAVSRLLDLDPILLEQVSFADGVLRVPEALRDSVGSILGMPDYESAGLRPTADDVRAEASRRMQVVAGARDAAHLQSIIANATREEVRLLRRGQMNWSHAEQARASELERLDAKIEHIRAVSNVLEQNPPADYADDKHWS